MRILLLGATGFIGTAVRRRLERTRRGHEMVNVAIAPPEGDAPGGWIITDLAAAPPEDMTHLVAGVDPDVVVNCIGLTTGDRRRLIDLNVRLVARILEAVEVAAPHARLVHLGSAAEYGRAPAERSVRETDPARPIGDYGLTKLLATEMVQAAARERGLDAVVLRVFNPVGAGAPEGTLAGRAALLIRDAMAAGEGEVRLGPLDVHRDFVDLDDVADAVAMAGRAPRMRGEILNVGSGHATCARDLVATLCGVAGFTGRVVETATGSPRSPAVPWQAADLGHVSDALGWGPMRDLRTSLTALWGPLAVRAGGETPLLVP